MSQSEAGRSTDDESLKDLFDQAIKMFDIIENGKEPTSSDAVQVCCYSLVFILVQSVAAHKLL